MALSFATTVASPSHGQWFGPNCRSLAQEQLKEIGPQLTELYAAAARNDNQALLGLALTGSVGAITFNRPIEVQVRSVEATAIERSNVQTRCRVRAPATITFGRPGIWVEETSSGPQLKRGNRDDTLEGEIVYDFVFAGREVLESGVESFMVVALVTYSTLRQREEQADPDVSRLIRQEQAEQQRRSNEARVRAENEHLIREEEQARARRSQMNAAVVEQVRRLTARKQQIAHQVTGLEERTANHRREIERMQALNAAGQRAPVSPRGLQIEIDDLRLRIADLKRQEDQLGAEIASLQAAAGMANVPQGPVTRENIAHRATSVELARIRYWANQCFIAPSGGQGQSAISSVRVRLRFAPDGTLTAEPEAIGMEESPWGRALATAAIRAVRQCAAQRRAHIPHDRYEALRDVVVTLGLD